MAVLESGSPSETGAPTILLAAADGRMRRALGRVLEQQGYRTAEAGTAAEATEMVGATPVDVALVDLDLDRGQGGCTLVRSLKELSPELQCIVLTSHGGANEAFEALKAGAYDYFETPISDWTRFGQVVRKAIEMRTITGQHERDRERFTRVRGALDSRLGSAEGEIVGRSSAIQRMSELVDRVARVRVPVAILGESGSGKELVARALHKRSPWADRPFVDVNCAAIPANLLESELFGHEKGSFTGAVQRKLGLFEVAEDGTIFLDEVAEMPIELQARLLRVIQEGEFRRVGGTRNLPAQGRIVSATNRDMKQAIREGRFREDLFYRLNVFEIHVPPLRDRLDDVPLLTWYFTQRFNRTYGKEVREIPDLVMNYLCSQDWHENNVRQLEHAVHRAIVLVEGHVLTLDCFDVKPRSVLDFLEAPEGAVHLPADFATLSYREAKERVVDSFSRAYLGAALAQAGGNVTQASVLADIDRPNFRKLLRKYGIPTAHQALSGDGDED
jgi:two-component system, NtrC family, response regulator HydG